MEQARTADFVLPTINRPHETTSFRTGFVGRGLSRHALPFQPHAYNGEPSRDQVSPELSQSLSLRPESCSIRGLAHSYQR